MTRPRSRLAPVVSTLLLAGHALASTPTDPSARPPRQPEPPAGSMSSRLRWLQQHAPLAVPDRGCAWLPAAPGCGTSAWVCVSDWASYGSGGGTFGRLAFFGTGEAEFAALDARSSAGRLVLAPWEPGPDALRGAEPFALLEGEEGFGGPIYDSCMMDFEEKNPLSPEAEARFLAGDDAAWPGREAAQAACEAAAEAGRVYTEDRCGLILVDACTGHLGVDCPSRQPRYSTPRFTAWTQAEP